MQVDIEKQKAFIDMLRDGRILTKGEIGDMFGVQDAHAFVSDIVNRTGLDIRSGTTGKVFAYFMATDARQETAGLDEMYEATEDALSDIGEEVEYQDGHYIMWVCPNKIDTQVVGGTIGQAYCSKFHKVDLGDEVLTRPKTVQCVQCGQKYQIKPKAWK